MQVGNAGGQNFTTPDPTSNQIRSLVYKSGWLGLERHRRVEEASELLTGLDAARLNHALAGLTDNDLRTWASDINTNGMGPWDGLTQDEKKDLFKDLAAKADGTQFYRLAKALTKADNRGGDILGSLVTEFASPETKLAFIMALAPQVTLGGQINSPGPLTIMPRNTSALAVGEVIASLKGSAVDAAFKKLDDDQLAAVMKAAEHEVIGIDLPLARELAPTVTVTHHAEPLARILEAAATGGDADTKASVFRHGVTALRDIQNTGVPDTNYNSRSESQRVTEALTHLLSSNTTGVVGALEEQDDSGRDLTTYMQEMFVDGRTAELGHMIRQLQSGNDLSRDPPTFLKERIPDMTGDPFYKNARDLGYFLGASQAAINKMNLDAKATGDTLTNLFTYAVLSGNQWITPKPAKVGLFGVNFAQKQVITAVVGNITSENRKTGDALFELAKPLNPKTRKPGGDLASQTELRATMDAVIGRN